jgi:hypothetical protein
METEEMKALGYWDSNGTRVFTQAEYNEHERIKHEVTMSTGVPHGRSMAVRISDYRAPAKCNCSCHMSFGEIHADRHSFSSSNKTIHMFPAHFVPKS